MAKQSDGITTLLGRWRCGERDAGEQLISLVYPELKRVAARYLRRRPAGRTLQPTVLVHELYISLFASDPITFEDRSHFFAVAAQQLRRIMIDHARAAGAEKRGGRHIRVTLDDFAQPDKGEDLMALDEALTRLAEFDARAARIVELRFFGGLQEKETAEVVGVSIATVKRDWDFARAWLSRQLARQPERKAVREGSGQR